MFWLSGKPIVKFFESALLSIHKSLCAILNMNKSLIFSLIASIIITCLVGFYNQTIIESITEFLLDINKPLASFSINSLIFSISIGIAPLLSYLIWNKRNNKTIRLLIAYNIINYCIAILLMIFTFIVIDKTVAPESLFLPDYIVYVPFKGFWNLIIPLSIVSTPIVLLMINYIKNKAHNNV